MYILIRVCGNIRHLAIDQIEPPFFHYEKGMFICPGDTWLMNCIQKGVINYPFPRLETVRMAGANVSSVTLLRILRVHRHTLVRMEIDARVLDFKHWSYEQRYLEPSPTRALLTAVGEMERGDFEISIKLFSRVLSVDHQGLQDKPAKCTPF
jgi:hypothetical protein